MTIIHTEPGAGLDFTYTKSEMDIRFGRLAALVLGMVIVFGVVVAILLQIIPAPRKETDYLVIGTLATFASLATLFAVLSTTVFKDSATLFFKRKKD